MGEAYIVYHAMATDERWEDWVIYLSVVPHEDVVQAMPDFEKIPNFRSVPADKKEEEVAISLAKADTYPSQAHKYLVGAFPSGIITMTTYFENEEILAKFGFHRGSEYSELSIVREVIGNWKDIRAGLRSKFAETLKKYAILEIQARTSVVGFWAGGHPVDDDLYNKWNGDLFMILLNTVDEELREYAPVYDEMEV